MHRLFKWLAEAPNSRVLQLSASSSGSKFICWAIEGNLIVTQGMSATGDGAVVQCAVGLMNIIDKPAGKGMKP